VKISTILYHIGSGYSPLPESELGRTWPPGGADVWPIRAGRRASERSPLATPVLGALGAVVVCGGGATPGAWGEQVGLPGYHPSPTSRSLKREGLSA